MNEDDLFAQVMGEVKPLKKAERVHTRTTKSKREILRDLENKEVSRQHTPQHRQSNTEKVEPYLLRAAGVSRKDIKKLAQTHIKHELDLHGMTKIQAEQALQDFFNQALSQNMRHLCIVHGKGNHSDGKGVLKDFTFRWLDHGMFARHILIATLSVQSSGGACNILLRKTKR